MSRTDPLTLGRLYCGFAALTLFAFGASAWLAGGDGATAGLMCCGVGVFVGGGALARPTRLLAIVIVCGAFCAFAAAAELTELWWNGQPPEAPTLRRWLAEAILGALSWQAGRPLFRAVTGGSA